MTRTRNMLLITAAVSLLLTACGNVTKSTEQSSTSAITNAFVLLEWSITPPTARLQAGKIPITASNKGSETHELVIVRASQAAFLPTKSDGSVDEDKIPEADKAGEIVNLAAGKSATKTMDLPAGAYVAFCNIVDQMGNGNGSMSNSGMGNGGMGNGGMGNNGLGHVHYRLGMVTQFTVT